MGILFLPIVVLLCSPVYGLIHHLTIKDDSRQMFEIETFGFMVGGVLNITVRDFLMHHDKKGQSDNKIGLLLRSSSSENEAQKNLEKNIAQGKCILDDMQTGDIFIDMSDSTKWKKLSTHRVIPANGAGLYSLIFARCRPVGNHNVNFVMDAVFVNPGPNYLSAGETPLPKMYMALFAVYSGALWLWCWVICRRNGDKANHIHYLMGALMAVKCLSLVCESIRYHYIALTGYSEGWSFFYYIFASLQGSMIFTVILLIGSGWSLVKPFLNSREKNVVLAVLVLQVLNNIAMVVIEETSPGSVGWVTWRDVLHLVDIACCIAILYPIFWSINHFRQAAEADGKAKDNLQKLQLFRQFYVMVLCYIYFTRVIVFLLTATVSVRALFPLSCHVLSAHLLACLFACCLLAWHLPMLTFVCGVCRRSPSTYSGWASSVWNWAPCYSSASQDTNSSPPTTTPTCE
jgi:G protein-coupled receptor 107